mgnify:FL=1
MVYYFCDLCDFTTINKTDYKRHITRKKHLANEKILNDPDTPDISCKRCNTKFISEDNLKSHIERNRKLVKMTQRACNDFACRLCKYSCKNSDELFQHQVECVSISKYHCSSGAAAEKRAEKLKNIKAFMNETGGLPASMDIERIKEKVGFLADDYPQDDYYHDYDFVNVDDWQIQYPDDDSMFFDKIMNVRNKIQYREKNYIIDGKLNAYDADDLCIGGFVEV